MYKIQELFSKKEDFGNKAISPIDQGWMQRKLDEQEMEYLWKCIDNKRKKDFRNKLAGNISNSYLLLDRGDWFWNNTIKPLIKDYEKYFWASAPQPRLITNQNHPLYLTQMWVNYQKQTEFNPVHSHTGVYSFVVWMQIPTNYNDQKENPIAKKSNGDVVSNFQINYVDILGKMQQHAYQMTKKFEGRMLFFPSELHHCVYPFYNCDKDRISISGNICLDTSVIV